MSRNIGFFGQNYIASSGIDTDAQAFLTATGITDATITTAIEDLVSDLKSYGLWTKMKAIYPLVGGTADTHKYNLKDPRDLDAAFRLVYSGSVTHNSNGITGAGGYADTKLSPSTSLTNNNTHFSLYSRTSAQNAGIDFGAQKTVGGVLTRLTVVLTFSDNNLYADFYNVTTNRISASNANGNGFYIITRTSSTSGKVFKNGSQLGSTDTDATSTNVTNIDNTLWILDVNDANSSSSRNIAFTSIGDGLDDTESSNLSTAIAAFQTSLGRNV